jgi:2,4-dienoyl-CoA reductase-like NADH-dependent reductase (Old Yellow Enzyme family)
MGVYDSVFEPIELAGVTLPHRIVRTAHGTGLSDEGLIAYHEARARGGVAMSVLHASGVHPAVESGLPVFDDSVVPFYERLVDRISPHGMKVFQQLNHRGAAYPAGVGGVHWSASDVPNPIIGVVPTPMTKPMIDELVGCFAAAARRCKRGGLDGVELHAASGYLLEQFLSPATNHRDDDYGGSVENRVRLLREVLEAVRAEVGPEFPVGVRFSAEEYIPGGLGPDDHAEIARMIEHLVDFVDAHMGTYWRFYKLLSTMDDPLGYEVPTSEVLTRAVDVPTIITGRIMTLDHASRLLASGVADMISMVRALIADPELVNKSRARREHEVRPCVGTNMGCVGARMTTGRVGCVVNVAAGDEANTPFETPGPAEVRKRVFVVGGGVAGLEAARTAALRGHEVTLHEGTKQLGGQLTIAASAPHRSDIGAITRWLSDEVERLDVEVHLNSFVDPDLVVGSSPDEIVVATGATPRRDGFQVSTPTLAISGAELPHVFTSWDVFGFGGRANIGHHSVVFDDTGTFEAISVADQLLADGTSVTFVSRFEALGAQVAFPPATVLAARERLMSGPFDFIGASYLRSISKDKITIGSPFTDRVREIPADTVIIVGFNHPNRELADALTAHGLDVHVVGDAGGGHGIQNAVGEASAIARQL